MAAHLIDANGLQILRERRGPRKILYDILVVYKAPLSCRVHHDPVRPWRHPAHIPVIAHGVCPTTTSHTGLVPATRLSIRDVQGLSALTRTSAIQGRRLLGLSGTGPHGSVHRIAVHPGGLVRTWGANRASPHRARKPCPKAGRWVESAALLRSPCRVGNRRRRAGMDRRRAAHPTAPANAGARIRTHHLRQGRRGQNSVA